MKRVLTGTGCTYTAPDTAPTVVVEAGLADFSFDWILVRQHVARFVRVCTHDRSGYGFSDPDRGRELTRRLIWSCMTRCISSASDRRWSWWDTPLAETWFAIMPPSILTRPPESCWQTQCLKENAFRWAIRPCV